MTAQRPAVDARQSDQWFPDLPDKLESAFAAYDLYASNAYTELEQLASQVEIEGTQIDYDSIVWDGRQLVAPGTIFVKLMYDPNSDEPVDIFDAYPLELIFSVIEGEVSILSVEADVSSFYK